LKVLFSVVLWIFLMLASGSSDAGQRGEHTVKSGESIAVIARFYGVDQETLRDANNLGSKAKIQVGDVLTIPTRLKDGWTKSHVVKQGDTIAKIARRYKIKRSALKEANSIGPKGWLKLGRRLVIPKGKQINPSALSTAKGTSKGVSKKKKWNGKVTFVRVRGNERKTFKILGKKGQLRKYARRMITRLSRSKKGKIWRINPRLIRLLNKVAKHYRGHEIEIISGFRPRKRGKKRSQHSKGRAMDFRVRGIKNLELYNFIKTFPKVGAGYYPNSTFVHLDVRKRKYLWTDISGPGEPAHYLKHGTPKTSKNIIDETTAGQPDPENFD